MAVISCHLSSFVWVFSTCLAIFQCTVTPVIFWGNINTSWMTHRKHKAVSALNSPPLILWFMEITKSDVFKVTWLKHATRPPRFHPVKVTKAPPHAHRPCLPSIPIYAHPVPQCNSCVNSTVITLLLSPLPNIPSSSPPWTQPSARAGGHTQLSWLVIVENSTSLTQTLLGNWIVCL